MAHQLRVKNDASVVRILAVGLALKIDDKKQLLTL